MLSTESLPARARAEKGQNWEPGLHSRCAMWEARTPSLLRPGICRKLDLGVEPTYSNVGHRCQPRGQTPIPLFANFGNSNVSSVPYALVLFCSNLANEVLLFSPICLSRRPPPEFLV